MALVLPILFAEVLIIGNQQISDSMTLMQDLVLFASDKQLRPDAAVEQLVAEYEKTGLGQNPQINLPQGQQQSGMVNGVPQGSTPRMGNMPGPQGFQGSPGIAYQGLPNGMNGSPHLHGGGLAPVHGQMGTPSPAQNHMAAPPMMPQHSQQGTNSSAASANTSPQVNNKRRRSTVKLEAEEGDGGGGQKVKPSPRMGKKNKPS